MATVREYIKAYININGLTAKIKNLEEKIYNLAVSIHETDSYKFTDFDDFYSKLAYEIIGQVIEPPENITYETIANDLENKKIFYNSSIFNNLKNKVKETRKENVSVVTITRGEYTCSRCKCQEISITQAQTRSADEGQTNFYTCTRCGSGWKKNN